MCGIAGYVGFDDRGDALMHVKALLTAQSHRGPDDEGILVYNPRDGHSRFLDRAGAPSPFPDADRAGATQPDDPTIILGSRRLAILDRSPAGRQPMATPDGRYVILLNGEIYNYVELGTRLTAKGHTFRSRTDTEVLLAAFVEWGASCLDHLVGMFAFAILDTETRRLFMARDPFGIKPLHFAFPSGGLVFSSEISAMLAWPGISRQVAPQPLHDYLDRGVLDVGIQTLFSDIRSLPPAHLLDMNVRDPSSATPVNYWRPDLDHEIDISFPEAVTKLRDLFLESVAMHLRSDVPVGAFLSGGVDSSSVVMAMRHVGGAAADIHTFSYIGGQGALSEEPWIDIVNEAAGAVSHKIELEPSEFTIDLEDLVESHDLPFGSIAIYAQTRLFERARREGVPVVLSGTGSDEMLGGYESFWPALFVSLLRHGSFRSAARIFGRSMRSGSSPARAALKTAASSLMLTLPADVQRSIVRRRAPQAWIDPSWFRARGVTRRGWPATNRRLLADRLWQRLAVGIPDLLRFEDRGGMAHSVEARVPFLTKDLAEFALALPAHHVIGEGGETKRALRAAMRGIVPDTILDRDARVAFAVPDRTWPILVGGFAELLESLEPIAPVNLDAIREPIDQIGSGRPINPAMALPLWRLAGLAAWARHFDVSFDRL